MNQTYAIRGTTLTALGDVVRGKVGETKFVNVTSDTMNVEWIHDKGIDYKSSSMWSISDKFHIQRTIFGLTKVKIHISKIESNGQFRFLVENATSGSNNVCDNYYNNGDGPIDLEFTDKFDGYVRVRLIAMGYTTWVKFTYTIEYYDFDDKPVAYQSEVKNTMTVEQMAYAIDGLMDPPPESAFNLTGNASYKFANGGWDWFIEKYGDKITCNIGNSDYMFQNSNLKTIPFKIKATGLLNSYMFAGCAKLEELPDMEFTSPRDMGNFCSSCDKLKSVPEDLASKFDWSLMESITGQFGGGGRSETFYGCRSLRRIPTDFFAHANKVAYYGYAYFARSFGNCVTLDELRDLPIPYTVDYTDNLFNGTVDGCSRLKEFTFEMPDGQPHVKNWKNQTITLTSNIGWGLLAGGLNNLNTDITKDKEVKDADTYAALKDDPDWFTSNVAYSRYNHDSAVNTINSLPDTSAYIASKGGTNTIKFKGAAGELTDGGAINTLTEEEIAVATAKGWTVTLV